MSTTLYEKEAMLTSLDEDFADLKRALSAAVGQAMLHEVEKMLFRRLQQLGQALLEWFIAESGTGYQAGRPPLSEMGVPLVYKGTVVSPYRSIFGEICITRAGYAHAEGGYFYPLDVRLNLPDHKYSYLLQKWLQAGACETDFRQAVDRFNEIFDTSFFPEVPQRMGGPIAGQVDPFYAHAEGPTAQAEGTHLAISADGKGIPMLPAERAGGAPGADPKPRLGKGEKRGTKKEATVVVDFSFDPHPRDPEELVNALMKKQTETEREQARAERHRRRQEGQLEPRQPRQVHVRATLQSKESAFRYLMERLEKRDPAAEKPLIALIDGKPELETHLREQLQAYQRADRLDALILDLIHASEYVWDVATALYGEKSPHRLVWVEDKLRTLLQSRVGRFIGGLKQRLTKNQLTPTQHKTLQRTITYFENHRHMMDYATYLAKGYPIATGLVEGTCGSLVKDRMEQSGMRWSRVGAQAILDQRAVMKNGEWDDFWAFYIEQERERLYSTTYDRAA